MANTVRKAAREDAPDPPGLLVGEGAYEDMAAVFQVLSNPSRLKIVHALMDTDLCVGELAMALHMSDSAVSHQLRLLRALRLVRHWREGKMVRYALDDDHVRQLFAATLEHLQE
jgi:ArsR family transcriptional regulator, lead/cadmium/zinc/bismuth-responsive transcriptional repressor